MSKKEIIEKIAESKIGFLSHFKQSFANPENSDIAIFLRGPGPGSTAVVYKFPAHHILLSLRTPYFKNATSHGFKEGIKGEIHMEEYDITPMIQVLQWMYTGDYDLAQEEIDAVLAKLETVGGSRKRKRAQSNKTKRHVAQTTPLISHLKIYVIADMLLVKELRAFVQLRFKRDLQFEETTKDKEGFSACCKNFAATIREVYSQPTANPLRKELVHAMLGWLTMYRRCSHYGARPVDFSTMVMSDEFKAVSKETDFGSDALEHVMSEGISHNSGLFRW